MKQDPEFKRYKGIIGKILYRLGLIPKSLNLPLFGVKGAGKSYFLLSLGMFISTRKLGKPENLSDDLLNIYFTEVLNGNLISITQGKLDVDLLITQVYSTDHKITLERQTYLEAGVTSFEQYDDQEQPPSDSNKLSTKIFLRTNDLSGQEFISAMEKLREPTTDLGGDPMTKKFIQVVQSLSAFSCISKTRHPWVEQ